MAFRSSQNITCHGYSYNVRAVFKRLHILVYIFKTLKNHKNRNTALHPFAFKKKGTMFDTISLFTISILWAIFAIGQVHGRGTSVYQRTGLTCLIVKAIQRRIQMALYQL